MEEDGFRFQRWIPQDLRFSVYVLISASKAPQYVTYALHTVSRVVRDLNPKPLTA